MAHGLQYTQSHGRSLNGADLSDEFQLAGAHGL
jgi:hypothetical protein